MSCLRPAVNISLLVLPLFAVFTCIIIVIIIIIIIIIISSSSTLEG